MQYSDLAPLRKAPRGRAAHEKHRRARSVGTWFAGGAPSHSVSTASTARPITAAQRRDAGELLAAYKAGTSPARAKKDLLYDDKYGTLRAQQAQQQSQQQQHQKRQQRRQRRGLAAHETHRRIKSWAAPQKGTPAQRAFATATHSFAPTPDAYRAQQLYGSNVQPHPPAPIAARRARLGTDVRTGLAHSMPAAGVASTTPTSNLNHSSRDTLRRKSSLEELAQLEELVEAKQRELTQRGVIPGQLGTARAVLGHQQHRQRPTDNSSSSNNAVLMAKLDDMEDELAMMRRATTEIVERVERLERERCEAPDVTAMLRGYAVHDQERHSHTTKAPVQFSHQLDRAAVLVTPEPRHSPLTSFGLANTVARQSPAPMNHRELVASPTTAFQTPSRLFMR